MSPTRICSIIWLLGKYIAEEVNETFPLFCIMTPGAIVTRKKLGIKRQRFYTLEPVLMSLSYFPQRDASQNVFMFLKTCAFAITTFLTMTKMLRSN